MTGEPIRVFLVFGQQIHQHRVEPALLKDTRDRLIARAVTAASAAVHEQYDTGCGWRRDDVGLQRDAADLKFFKLLLHLCPTSVSTPSGTSPAPPAHSTPPSRRAAEARP